MKKKLFMFTIGCLVLIMALSTVLSACSQAAASPTSSASRPSSSSSSAAASSASTTSPVTSPSSSSPATAPSSAQTIKIGFTVPLTGVLAANGILAKQGYELAAQRVNADGGIFVKEYNKAVPVELVSYDDESDPTKATTMYETLYSNDKVNFFLGTYSNMDYSAVAVAEKHKTPIVMSFNSDPSLNNHGYKYMVSPFLKAPDFIKVLDAITDVTKANGIKPPSTLALVSSKTPAAIALADMFTKEAPAHGYKVVVNETYPMGAQDYSAIILKAKQANAEVWFSLATAPEGIAMVRQMKELDYNPSFISMPLAASSQGWPGKTGDVGDFVGNPQMWNSALNFPGSKQMVDDYVAKYNTKPWVDVGCAYVAAQVLFNAIAKAGTLNKDAVRDALFATDMDTIAGPIKFNPNGTPININILVNQWQNGVYQVIWPKSEATADAIIPAPKWSDRK